MSLYKISSIHNNEGFSLFGVGWAGYMVTVARSSLPQVRWIIVEKWSMLRKPRARVLMCWMMPFNPSRIALVHRWSKYVRMSRQ